MSRVIRLARSTGLMLATTLLAAPAMAADPFDLPGFDRPGLLFATDTTPVDHFILEQGLPDFTRIDDGNSDLTYFALNSLLRYGINSDWELQLGLAPFATVDIDTPAGDFSESGYTDLRIGAKRNLSKELGADFGGAQVAFLAGVSLATGDDAFTADDEIFDLGLTSTWSINGDQTVGVLAQLTTGAQQDDLLLAGSFGAPINRYSAYYVEAGILSGDNDGSVIGGGITWIPLKDMQFDAYLRAGTGDAPDLQAGFGISIYFR